MTTNDNWKAYRNTLKTRDPPCLPYLGLYFTDLTFIEDGNPDFLDKEGSIINFVKCQHLSTVIQDIQQYQQRMYYFQEVKMIQNFFSVLAVKTEDELYEISLEVEPRVRVDSCP